MFDLGSPKTPIVTAEAVVSLSETDETGWYL